MFNLKRFLPLIAFIFALGAAFTTKAVNSFQGEVWRKSDATPCESTPCVLEPQPEECSQDEFLYYDNPGCTGTPITAYEPD